jgi:hypothetical protein
VPYCTAILIKPLFFFPADKPNKRNMDKEENEERQIGKAREGARDKVITSDI